MDRLRFSDAHWIPDTTGENLTYTKIGGAGGIGSWLTLFLNRIGYITEVWDYDTIEPHNIGGQFYRSQQNGISKVRALRENINAFGDSNSFVARTSSVEELEPDDCVFYFSAFDNMRARKIFFQKWKEACSLRPDAKGIFIDGRLEMEQLQIFCVPYEERFIARYEERLFDDSLVPDLPCSMKQTSHTAAMISSLMTSFFTNHFANIKYGFVVREVPFLYEYVVAGNITKYEILEDGRDFIPQL